MTNEKEKLVLDNLKMVPWVLKNKLNIYPDSTNYDEYYDEGILALVKAANKYEPDRGILFSTYAIQVIHGYLLTFIRTNGYSLCMRRPDYDIFISYNKNGRDAEKTCQTFNISKERLDDILKYVANVKNVSSLSEVVCNGNSRNKDGTLEEIIPDDRDLFQEIEDLETVKIIIDQIVDTYKPPHIKSIVREYLYSRVCDDQPIQQAVLADKYGITQSYVSRIISNIPKKAYSILNKHGIYKK